METRDFGWAIRKLKAGKGAMRIVRVAREGWNRSGMWLELQVPDEHSKMQQPYIFITPAPGARVPWVASQPDMLAEDWFELE